MNQVKTYTQAAHRLPDFIEGPDTVGQMSIAINGGLVALVDTWEDVDHRRVYGAGSFT